MKFGKKGVGLAVEKLIKIVIVIVMLLVLFYFLKSVGEAGNTFLGMFD